MKEQVSILSCGAGQEISLYQHRDSCPYFPARERLIHYFACRAAPPSLYETLISRGFRRSGLLFYRNNCPDCCDCLPLRIDIRHFSPAKSQRRVLRKNRDLVTSCRPPGFFPEDFSLYRRYCARRHAGSPVPGREDYVRFLIESPVPTEIMRHLAAGRLAGLGWFDLLPQSLSSVYISFDPDDSKRSLGTYTILKQVEMCAGLGKDWLHLGFWIREHPKMSYKNRFRPCQVLLDGQWRELS